MSKNKSATKYFDEESLRKMLINPFYAITINPILSMQHKPLVTKKEWIKVATKMVEEIGPEKTFNYLLEVLEGGYV